MQYDDAKEAMMLAGNSLRFFLLQLAPHGGEIYEAKIRNAVRDWDQAVDQRYDTPEELAEVLPL